MLITNGMLDLTVYQKDSRLVNIDNIQHKDVREVVVNGCAITPGKTKNR